MEQSNPINVLIGAVAPTRVAKPLLDHPFGLKNSTRGEPPSLLGDKTQSGIKITMPRT